MTTHDEPAAVIDKVTEQLYSLLSAMEARVMPPRSGVEHWARESVATCNGIVADDIEVIAKLDALTRDDPEDAHFEADGLLRSLARPTVRTAYDRARERVGFWFA